ncbi:hypothetical protein [Actinomadura citrea]|uniref:Uncharacterized protein n=1 Tax=Actinomadura citrea TaxID=46158 RepID=A0A7Y9KD56_9ACTN|nr:hypothetical protein [Actinomadura citrea]NYE14722.1 hypothetical protein [Actinomadura citrea]GGT83370.1 hypothetical protein GCM10010177_48140 [Actinomadura citrea]
MRTGPLPAPGRVDQIVFAWSDRLLAGGRGLGPVATSLGTDGLRVWNERLAGGDVAVGQWLSGAAECAALGALRFGRQGEHGAALRLVPARDPNGRPSQLVHALVGPASVVNAALVLGLHRWPEWSTPDRLDATPSDLEALDATALWAHAEAGLDEASARRDALVGLLAGVLAAPCDPYLAEISPDDVGLVAGLVRRLDGVAGAAPLTMLLGAQVTRPELRPRLLAVGLPDARNGRTSLTTTGGADPGVARVAELLADLPPTSLTRPRAPLRTTAALADWVEAEHQRATGVLDLVDRAIAGTLDEPERRYLNGPDGQERLRAELRNADMAQLTDRLLRWTKANPPRLSEVARTLRQVAADRYLTDAGEDRDTADRLLQAARRMDLTAAEARRVLANWYSGLPKVTSADQYSAVYFALGAGIDPASDETFARLLPGMKAASLLEWSRVLAPSDHVKAALHFMRAAHRQWSRGDRRGDEGVRALMRETEMFHETIHDIVSRCGLRTEDENDLYRTVLHLAYGDPVTDLAPVLGALPADAEATEFRPWAALADVFGGDRAHVFQLAAQARRRKAPPTVLRDMLGVLSSTDLIQGMAEQTGQPGLLEPVCHVLGKRPRTPAEQRATCDAALAGRFLAGLVEGAWPDEPEIRFKAYSFLLQAVYQAGDRADGGGLTRAEVDELVRAGGTGPFLLAVVAHAAQDAVVPALLHAAHRHAADLGLPSEIAESALRGPHRAAEARTARRTSAEPAHAGLPHQRHAQHAHQGQPAEDGPAPTATAFPEPPIPPQHFSFNPPPTRRDHFPSGSEQEEPDDGRHPIVVWITGRTLQEWAIAVLGLGIVVLLVLLLFGGSDGAPPPRQAPTTVTVTVTPSVSPTTSAETPSGGDRSPQPTTGKTP